MIRVQGSHLHLDQIINTQNGNSGFCCKLEALDLALAGLNHTGLETVTKFALDKVQTNPADC